MNRARLAGVVRHLSERMPKPDAVVILGSGLGAFADRLQGSRVLPYSTIPGFPVPGVAGHAGRLSVGTIEEATVAVLQGRVHMYEGWRPEDVVLPLRALLSLGASKVVITNAAGALNPDFAPGQLMLLTDQINHTGQNPAVGPHNGDQGPRFLDMTTAYCPRLQQSFRAAASRVGISWVEGVYLGLPGPAYETPAEIRALQSWGAQAVGMSTVLEVLAARQAGADVLGISCLTNLGAGLQEGPLSHHEVQAAAAAAQAGLSEILCRVLADSADPG